jgi:hypothetical protein
MKEQTSSISLFSFMLNLRANPKMLVSYFPELETSAEEAEPRNLSRELKGTIHEMKDFVVVYGFGTNLSHVVAVAFQSSLDTLVEPTWAADHEVLVKVYGVKPIVMALTTDDVYDKYKNSRTDIN